MIKRLALLNGIAILAVVINHATHLAMNALYRKAGGEFLNIALGASLGDGVAFFLLTALRKLAVFSVPAFLFFAGFFVAFASRSGGGALSGRVIRQRIIGLLIPYLVWSGVVFVLDALNGIVLMPESYLKRLVVGGAIPHYFFVPLLVQFYLISPVLVYLARCHPGKLMVGSAFIQGCLASLPYLTLEVESSLLIQVLSVMKYWSWFPMWAFFFAFGLVAHFHLEKVRNFLHTNRRLFLSLALFMSLVAIGEAVYVQQVYGLNWNDSPLTLPSMLFALSVLIAFLGFDKAPVPFPGLFAKLSGRTFGIYLMHTKVIALVFWYLSKYSANSLDYPVAVFGLLVFAGISFPYVFMELISRSPARPVYRYLFG